jgi:hypothetical protein
MLRRMLPYLPSFVQRMAVKYGARRELVPMDPLKNTLRASLRWLVDVRGDAPLGDYLEFGVFQGTSLSCMHQVSKELGIRTSRIRLFGFDSFEGLPDSAAEETGGVRQQGDFKASLTYATEYLTYHGINWNRVKLIVGWFGDTLTPTLINTHGIERACVIMIDCDLYSSAKQALDFCLPLIKQEAILIFDDWYAYGETNAEHVGEGRAFVEFVHENPQFGVEEVERYSQYARVFRIFER